MGLKLDLEQYQYIIIEIIIDNEELVQSEILDKLNEMLSLLGDSLDVESFKTHVTPLIENNIIIKDDGKYSIADLGLEMLMG